jgi:hypothetical protein
MPYHIQDSTLKASMFGVWREVMKWVVSLYCGQGRDLSQWVKLEVLWNYDWCLWRGADGQGRPAGKMIEVADVVLWILLLLWSCSVAMG